MATTINASTSGLIETSDGTAVLALQTGGTNAVTINATQAIGVGSSPSYGTAGQFLTSQGSGASPTWTSGGSGTVTSVSWTGGIVSVATATTTPAFTIAGTSGGIVYFSSASTWASSGALTQYGVVYGGGAGGAPVATAAGTTGQFLGANTGGAPTWQTPSGGGSPGGTSGQVQYNNSSSFGGSANFFWDSTNNRLGIGTSDVPKPLTVLGGTSAGFTDVLQISAGAAANDSGPTMVFNAANGNYTTYKGWQAAAIRASGSNSGTNYESYLAFYTNTGGSQSTITEKLRLNASGAVVLAGGTVSATGVGIAFPASPSISSNVNTLDDYERGTWTPTDGSGAGLTFTVNSAIYVKIGRLVLLTCDITLPSTASTATLTINIPFNASTPAYGQTGSFARNNKTLSFAPMTALNGLIFLAPTSFTTYIQNVAMTAGTMQFNIAYYTDA